MIFQPATPEAVAHILTECSGHVGTESEAVLNWHAGDDYVDVFSSRGSIIAAILRRCGDEVTHVGGGAATGWTVRVPLKARNGSRLWRGFEFAFTAPSRGAKRGTNPFHPEAA